MPATYNDSVFRAQFPNFADTTAYPQALLSMFFGLACEWIDPNSNSILTSAQNNATNGGSLQYALNMMTAHIFWLAMNVQGANGGAGGIGQAGGFVQGSSIDKVSVNMLAPPLENGDMYGYWLAQSPYGQSLAAFLKMKAAGGTFVGGAPESMAFRRSFGRFY